MSPAREADLSPLPSATPADPSALRAAMRTWQHDRVPVAGGVRLHVVVAGTGDPVLLIAGWPQSWYCWRSVLAQLVAAGRQVIAVDPRGFGDSDIPPTGYDMATAAEDIRALADRFAPADGAGVDVVGHDVGAWIAHAFAVAHPDAVRRLALLDAHIPGVSPLPPAGFPDSRRNARSWHFGFNRIEGLPEALIQGRERVFLSWIFGPEKVVRTWRIEPDAFEEYLRAFRRPGAVRAGLQYYREMFSDDGLAASADRARVRLDGPVLTVGGEHGVAGGLAETARRFSDDVHGVVVPGVGHQLPEECPDEVAAALLAFWGGDDGRPATGAGAR
jgi:pimeloyl-ACP methyl ester carboxylesterase